MKRRIELDWDEDMKIWIISKTEGLSQVSVWKTAFYDNDTWLLQVIPKEDKVMKRVNMNHLAKKVSKLEGGKHNMSIAQIHEVGRHYMDELSKYTDEAITTKMVERRKKRKR